MTEQDARAILSLEPGCTPEQVREAYKDLVKVWHPDRFANDERLREKAARRLQEINQAYALLQGDADAGAARASVDRAASVDTEWTPDREPAPAAATDSNSSLVRLIATGAALGFGVVAIVTMVFWPQLRPSAPVDSSVSASAIQETPLQDSTALSPRSGNDPSPRVQRPVSGSELITPERQGGGSLVVYNQSQHDGVVSLVTPAGSERAVYVRAGEQATLANVATGRYQVRMALGREWVENRFSRDASYQELEEPVDFVEAAADSEVEFTRLTLSLQPVVAGMQGVRPTAPFLLGK
jgi:hypothetical protein